jgi:hypothetical protein
MTMFIEIRKRLIQFLWSKQGTSLMVGSYISDSGERSIGIRLADGWKETAARLSPEGARACARQLDEWADWAEKGRTVTQWQAIVRTATKFADSPPEETAPEPTTETAVTAP